MDEEIVNVTIESAAQLAGGAFVGVLRTSNNDITLEDILNIVDEMSMDDFKHKMKIIVESMFNEYDDILHQAQIAGLGGDAHGDVHEDEDGEDAHSDDGSIEPELAD